MTLTKQMLTDVIELAKRYYAQTPVEARISGSTTSLTPAEQVALSYVNAVATILNRTGCQPADLRVVFENYEHDPV